MKLSFQLVHVVDTNRDRLINTTDVFTLESRYDARTGDLVAVDIQATLTVPRDTPNGELDPNKLRWKLKDSRGRTLMVGITGSMLPGDTFALALPMDDLFKRS